jgi:hypothetical protein
MYYRGDHYRINAMEYNLEPEWNDDESDYKEHTLLSVKILLTLATTSPQKTPNQTKRNTTA